MIRARRSRAASLALFSISALAAARAAAGDWPQWRGERREGVWANVSLPERLAPERIERRWRVPVGGGYSGIAVAAGKVYTQDRPPKSAVERVLCLDAATGTTLWTHEYGAEYGDLDYGNGPRGTPLVDAGTVFTIGAVGHIQALEAASGKPLWSIDTRARYQAKIPQWGHASSPLRAGELIVFQVGGQPEGTVMAFEAASGRAVWRALADRPSYSSPIAYSLGGEDLIAVWTADSVAALAAKTGKVLWRIPFKSTYDVAIISPVIAGGTLFVSGYWEGSRALDLRAGKEPVAAWGGKGLSCLMSTPLVRDGCLFALDKDEGLFGVDLRDGNVLWKDGHRVTPKARNPQAWLVWAGERAVILNELGELILARLSREGYEELGRAPISAGTWAHPAFSGQHVYVRNDTEMVCVRVQPGD